MSEVAETALTAADLTVINYDAAQSVASHGLFVVPCWPDKSPIIKGAYKNASNDSAQIEQWWQQWPDAIPGISCELSGLVVFDCDLKPAIKAVEAVDGKPAVKARVAVDGVAAFLAILREDSVDFCQFPAVRIQSGGIHMYCKAPAGFEPSNAAGSLPAGIDVRSAGHVIAPGAVMPNGRRYLVTDGTPNLPLAFMAGNIPELPAKLRARLEVGKPLGVPAVSPGPQPPAPSQQPPSPPGKRDFADAEAALADECRTLAATPEGGRNAAANKAAFVIATFIAAGSIDESRAVAGLMAAALQCGLAEGEAAKTIGSGIAAGKMRPRVLRADREPPLVDGLADTVARMAADHAATSLATPAGTGQLPAALPTPVAPIVARPFKLVDPGTIPQRQWLYGKHYIREFISGTIAPGGLGKSSLVLAEALAMVTGINLLKVEHPAAQPLRVWLINGEDPYVELERRVGAVALLYGITSDDIGDRLFINSGRDTDFTIAETTRDGTFINQPNYAAIVQQIRNNKIDVLTVDPFISSHKVSENDNNAIDFVVKTWNKIAQETNCAIELVHHARKGNGNETTVDDARGAKALTDAARSVRLLNRMTSDQAKDANIAADKAQDYFRVNDGKANLARASHGGVWYEVQGVPLKNGGTITVGNANIASPGDSVGVVKSWTWPATASQIDADIIEHVQNIVRGGNYRASEQSPDWVGYVIGSCFGYDKVKGHATNKRAMVKLVAQLISEGWLKVVTRHEGDARRDKPFVEVGKTI